MIVKNKFLKFSSLCVIGSITIIMNQILPSHANDSGFTGISVNNSDRGTVSSGINGDTSGNVISSVTISNDSGVVDVVEIDTSNMIDSDISLVDIPDDEVPAEAEPEATEEPEEDKNAIPGIDYREYMNKNDYTGLGICNVQGYLNVRKAPSQDSSDNIIAKMPPNAGCTILEETTNDAGEVWCKVKSGEITGYVMKMYLYTGDDAKARIADAGSLVIVVTCDVLNLREKASTDAGILYQISKGERVKVVSVSDEWVEVETDIGEDSGFVSRIYVDVSFEWDTAIEVDEALIVCSTLRTQIVNYAKKFLGNPYVYGGTDLYKGIDCSAYVRAIYREFDFELPRTSAEQASTKSAGTVITESQIMPGDLVFYATNGTVKHVAMYIGNGKIIHASNHRDGIKISNMKYTTPYRYKNIIGDL